jgi:hypothetical protein
VVFEATRTHDRDGPATFLAPFVGELQADAYASRIIWRISFVATRSAMPDGIMALSIVGLLPLVVVLAAIGSNTYWISVVLKLRELLGDERTETVAA